MPQKASLADIPFDVAVERLAKMATIVNMAKRAGVFTPPQQKQAFPDVGAWMNNNPGTAIGAGGLAGAAIGGIGGYTASRLSDDEDRGVSPWSRAMSSAAAGAGLGAGGAGLYVGANRLMAPTATERAQAIATARDGHTTAGDIATTVPSIVSSVAHAPLSHLATGAAAGVGADMAVTGGWNARMRQMAKPENMSVAGQRDLVSKYLRDQGSGEAPMTAGVDAEILKRQGMPLGGRPPTSDMQELFNAARASEQGVNGAAVPEGFMAKLRAIRGVGPDRVKFQAPETNLPMAIAKSPWTRRLGAGGLGAYLAEQLWPQSEATRVSGMSPEEQAKYITQAGVGNASLDDIPKLLADQAAKAKADAAKTKASQPAPSTQPQPHRPFGLTDLITGQY